MRVVQHMPGRYLIVCNEAELAILREAAEDLEYKRNIAWDTELSFLGGNARFVELSNAVAEVARVRDALQAVSVES